MRTLFNISVLSLLFSCNTGSLSCDLIYLENVCPKSECSIESIRKGDSIVTDHVLSENLCGVLNTLKDTFSYKSNEVIWERDIFRARILKLGQLNQEHRPVDLFSIEVKIALGNYKSLIALSNGYEVKVLEVIDISNNYLGEFDQSNLLEEESTLYKIDKKNRKLFVYKLIKTGTYIGGMDTVTVDLSQKIY